ncbi:hypothetical protein BDZ45DRAFT_92026 [Acephala macrosclerotiorum]|nr:hypothetical protein BDZ45DRAFT_92026 [Acephala macrosclerotiorum]
MQRLGMASRYSFLFLLSTALGDLVIPVDRREASETSLSTVVESSTIISSCFSATTSISISSCTGLNITKVPICISTILTASTTLSLNSSSRMPNLTATSLHSTSSQSSFLLSSSSTISSTNISTAYWFAPTVLAIDGLCGETTGQTCENSTWGNCCSASGDCGHNAFYCGIGCQHEYGSCTNPTIDGSCGNGISCYGSKFGHCCSASYWCGNGDHCREGCRPEFGKCEKFMPSSSSSSRSSSTSWSSSISTSIAHNFSSSMNYTNATNSTSSASSSGSSSSRSVVLATTDTTG